MKENKLYKNMPIITALQTLLYPAVVAKLYIALLNPNLGFWTAWLVFVIIVLAFDCWLCFDQFVSLFYGFVAQLKHELYLLICTNGNGSVIGGSMMLMPPLILVFAIFPFAIIFYLLSFGIMSLIVLKLKEWVELNHVPKK